MARRDFQTLISKKQFGALVFQGPLRGTRLFSLLLSIFLCLSAPLAHARGGGGSGRFGLGIAIGDPSAITGKFWLDGRQAVDVGLAFNFDRYFLVYSDYNLHWPGAFGGQLSTLAPYLGIGGLLVVDNERHWYWRDRYRYSDSSMALGLRIPLGIEWLPRTAPIGVFAEIAPGLTIIPGTWGFFTGAIGARFYF